GRTGGLHGDLLQRARVRAREGHRACSRRGREAARRRL
ncbi:MAG: hypothetical protein AVDCRST_MAG55-115, partial [uncultured Rubrobacteraceae bacterium]